MQIKILIKTPKGHAKKTEFQIRPFLIGNKGKIHKIMTNAEDNKILWIVDAKEGQYFKIIKNVSAYRTMISAIMGNKTVKKVARITPEQEAELNDMLLNQTEIDVVLEKDWDKIKKEFKEI